MIPVFAAVNGKATGDWLTGGEAPAILYPTEVFFGRLIEREVRSRLPAGFALAKRAETALSPAALNLALEGVGLAWIPRSLCSRDLARGALADLSGHFPSVAIEIAAFRLRRSDPRAAIEDTVWQEFAAIGDIVAKAHRIG